MTTKFLIILMIRKILDEKIKNSHSITLEENAGWHTVYIARNCIQLHIDRRSLESRRSDFS